MTTLHEVENYLNQVLINREEEIDSLITAVCAGEHILILGPPGCKSEDTILHYKRGKRNSSKKITIKEFYKKFNGIKTSGPSWDLSKDTFIHSWDPKTGKISYNKVLQAHYSGKKECIRVVTDTHGHIDITPEDQLLVGDKFIHVSELKVGDVLTVKGDMKPVYQGGRRPNKKRVTIYGLKYYNSGWKKTVLSNGITYNYKCQHRARLVVEANMNGISYDDYINELKNNPYHKLITLPSHLDVHHKDEDSMNDSLENLEVLTKEEHLKLHKSTHVKNLNVDYTDQCIITNLIPIGMKETYELTVNGSGDECNFTCNNGIIAHNTGKSQLVRELAGCVSDAKVFYRLLSYHMSKEELFGPLSLSALREDRYEYKVDGYLPTAHLAYLDEIGKCHPSMLNTMLMILNEREFTNAGKQVTCPLITCIGTSNELFEEGAEALYDRFFFKHSVSYLSKKKDFFRLQEDVRDKEDVPKPIIRLEDIAEIRNRSKSVTFPDEIIKGLWKFKTVLEEGDNPICVSDRTWAKIQKISKVRAALADKDEVDASVMSFLVNVCWDKPEDKPHVETAYRKAFVAPPESKKKAVMPASEYRAKQKDLYEEDSSFISLIKAKDDWEKACEKEMDKEYLEQNVENMERLVSEGELLAENFKKLWEHSNSVDIRDQAEMYYQDVDALVKSVAESILDIDMDIEASISSESQFDPSSKRTYYPSTKKESTSTWPKSSYERELRKRMGRKGGY